MEEALTRQITADLSGSSPEYHSDSVLFKNGHIIVRSDGISYTVYISRDGPRLPALINLNTATLEELQYIIHIGPGRAGQIMQLRPFELVDDLIRVDGIGPVRLEDIKRQNIVVVE